MYKNEIIINYQIKTHVCTEGTTIKKTCKINKSNNIKMLKMLKELKDFM